MKSPREADIQRSCRQWLALVALPIRVNSAAVKVDGRFFRANDQPGCSDLVVCLPPAGRFCAVEVKRPGGRVTPGQKSFLDRVAALGGLALVVTSLDDLREQLAAEGFNTEIGS